MVRSLIQLSIKHAKLVIIAALVLMAMTLMRLPQMSVDVFPELNSPKVVVLTEAGSLSSLEVEQYVSQPIERSMGGLPGVRNVRSSSANSLSLITVEFDWGEDIYRARQLVSESLDIVREQLPEDVHVEVAPISGLVGEIMMVSLTSDLESGTQASPIELRSYAEYNLRQQLLSVQGVAQVVAIGGELPEYQITPRMADLQLWDISLEELAEAADGAHSLSSAGFLPNDHGQELAILQSTQLKSIEQLKQVPVRYEEGNVVRLEQVADVAIAPAPPRGSASKGHQPAVVIGIKKSPSTNTLAVTDRLDKVFAQIENSSLPDGMVLDTQLFRQSHFIDRSLDNVTHVLRDAAIIVAVILILFLLNVRTTLITLTAIPLSLGVAILAMAGLGETINVMTLGGLAIAIGELVDDAIIDVENVAKRLRENAMLPQKAQRAKAVVIFDACNEVRSSVIFATLIIMIVFVPLLFLDGIEGRFFRPMGLAYIIAICASLLVAMTVVPAMCYLLLGRKKAKDVSGDDQAVEVPKHRQPLVPRFLQRVYTPLLELALRMRIAVLGLAAALTAGSLILASTFGADFLPKFQEGTLLVTAHATPGTSLAESERLTVGLTSQIEAIDGVRSAVRRTGRAERDEHAHGVEISEIVVSLEDGAEVKDVIHDIDVLLQHVPGLETLIGAPIAHQISMILAGQNGDVTVSLYGDDLGTLRLAAQDADAALGQIPGARDILANREALLPGIRIDYNDQQLAYRLGITREEAARQVAAGFKGLHVETVQDGQNLIDVVVRLPLEDRGNIDDVRSFMLMGRQKSADEDSDAHGAEHGDAHSRPQTHLARLEDVASVNPTVVPLGIQHENGSRKAVITLNVAEGENLKGLVQKVDEAIAPIARRHQLTYDLGGQFEAQQSARRTLLITGSLTALGVLVMLSTAFGSLRAALLVMVNLPLALIGGITAVFITEGGGLLANTRGLLGLADYVAPVLSIASLVGFITLFGIAVRNGLLLVNHYQDLLKEGMPLREAVIHGSRERLIPILMTALTAILGMLPLALQKGQPGSELLAPLAIVVLGGLLTSTLLNLFVVPAGYLLVFGRSDAKINAEK